MSAFLVNSTHDGTHRFDNCLLRDGAPTQPETSCVVAETQTDNSKLENQPAFIDDSGSGDGPAKRPPARESRQPAAGCDQKNGRIPWLVSGGLGALLATSIATPWSPAQESDHPPQTATDSSEEGNHAVPTSVEPSSDSVKPGQLNLTELKSLTASSSRRQPPEYFVLIEQAGRSIEKDDPDTALALVHKAQGITPPSQTRARLLAACIECTALTRLGEFAEAVHTVRPFRQVQPTEPTRRYLAMLFDCASGACDAWADVVTDSAIRRSIRDEAAEFQNLILDLFPADQSQRVSCCRRLNKLQRYEETLALTHDFQSAGGPSLLLQRTIALQGQGRHAEARRALTRVLHRQPEIAERIVKSPEHSSLLADESLRQLIHSAAGIRLSKRPANHASR